MAEADIHITVFSLLEHMLDPYHFVSGLGEQDMNGHAARRDISCDAAAVECISHVFRHATSTHSFKTTNASHTPENFLEFIHSTSFCNADP